MTNERDKKLDRLFFALALVMAVLFFASIFKHLSYPLLWNDEGDTAMYATRILEYGFPKVHDGKNVVYVHPVDISIGVNKYDMFTADLLMTYYWAAPGAWLASKAGDIYAKTFLFRAPLALMGYIGVLAMALSAASLFEKGRPARPLFLAVFMLLATMSISLALHIKEARCYSPMLLLSSGIFFVYIKHRLFGGFSFKFHASALIVLLLFLYLHFYPLYVVFIAFFGLYESLDLWKLMRQRRKHGKALALPGIRDLKHFIPLVVSVLTVVPFFILFRTMDIITAASGIGSGMGTYIGNLYFILSFFARHEFLYLALFVKAVLAFMVVRGRLSGTGPSAGTAKKLRVSNFLTAFFIVHVLVISGTPWIFTRYVIVLIPVLSIVLLLDAFSAFELLGRNKVGSWKGWQRAFLAASAGIFLLTAFVKAEDLKERVYELTYQYMGPLDYMVNYVKDNYEKPEDLVIATNYEDASLMFYLGSKVIIGHAWNNIWEDLKETPDIIIDRNFWTHNRNLVQRRLLKKADYEQITFPVLDYPVNNIPDLHYQIRHLYRTPIAEDGEVRLKIYIRKDLPRGGARQAAGDQLHIDRAGK